MAFASRHAWELLRVAVALVAVCAPALSIAQVPTGARPNGYTVPGSFGPPPAANVTAANVTPAGYAPAPYAPPVAGPALPPGVVSPNRVIEIRIIGNRNITRDKVLSNISTHVDQPFDQVTFEKDVRKLHGKGWFVSVRPQREQTPSGIVITLEVIERPVLEEVRYLGNTKYKAKTLAKETGLKQGESMDAYAIEEGRRKIETFYANKGFGDARCTVLEGTKPGDRRAVYLINEGTVKKVWNVEFEGNTVASDERLQKAVIQSKPPLFWVFKGFFDRKKVDDDVERITNYYRGLGFFKAHVGRDYEFNEKENWVTLTFHINEGPRYRVKNISFVGNQRYDETVFQENLKLNPGDYFDQSKMNADVSTVKDLYGSNGFVFAAADPDLRFYEEPGALDLVYQITEGKQYAVGEINVHIGGDNPHTRTFTALNFIALRPGDIIDITKIRSGEKKLKASSLFNNDPTKGDVPRIVVAPPDGDDNPRAKTKNIAKKNGTSARGQSPDGLAAQSPPHPAATSPELRGQSPDDGYGGKQVNFVCFPRPAAANCQSAQPGSASAPSCPAQYNTPPTDVITGQPLYQPQAQAPGYYGGQPQYQQQQPNYGQQQPYYPPQQIAPGQYAAQPAYQQPETLPPQFPARPIFPGSNFLSEPPLMEEPLPQLPVDIYLNEAQTGRFMFGVGVNSNAGLVGNIVLDERNFDWRRVPSSWEDFRSGRAFRGAGQTFRIEAAPGTQVQRYMVEFAEPFLFDTPISFGMSGWFFNRFYRDWNEQRLGGRFSLGRQFSPDLSGNLAVKAEDILMSNFRVAGIPDLDAVEGHTALYTFSGSLQHNTRDNFFLATEGHLLRLDFDYAIGSFQFPRLVFDARQHFLLRERPDGSGRHVLSLYNSFGVAGDDTPIYERFFAGGYSTLRGFQFRGASPQVNTVEVGGNFQNLSTIEYMFPITADDMLRAVTFVDFGTVEPSINDFDWRNFRVAPGVGFRVSIPALGPAPIALDFAVPVQYAPTDIRQVFSFFVGFGR